MSVQQRIRVLETSPPGLKIKHNETGEELGEFVPGLGYWITEQNSKSVAFMLHRGYAELDDPANAPKLPTELRAAEGELHGFVKVGD